MSTLNERSVDRIAKILCAHLLHSLRLELEACEMTGLDVSRIARVGKGGLRKGSPPTNTCS